MDKIDEIPRAKRRLRWWHCIGAVLAVGLLVLLGIRFRDRANLEGRFAAIRAAGYPVTFAELDAWYEDVPYGENAAEYVLDAITCLRKLEKEQAQQLPWYGRNKMPARTEPLDENVESIIAGLLQKNQEAIRYLRKAGALDQSRYPIDLTRGHAALLPHLSDLRGTVRLLCLEAILHAERGEPQEATEALASAFGVANTEAATPLLLSQMVCRGGQSTALSALERVVNRTALSEAQLTRLSQTVATACDPNAIMRGFVGERCMVIQALRNPGSTGLGFAPVIAQEGPSLLQLHAARAVGMIDRLLVQYIDYVDRFLAALRLPPEQRLEAVRPLEREHEEMRQAHPALTWIMPALHRFLRNDLTHLTKLKVASTALAVERYRLANGRLPAELGDLVPRYLKQIPVDPYNGASLKYERHNLGFVVYSIGKDGVDDGGTERARKPRGQEEPNYDLTFIVEHQAGAEE